MYIKLFCYISTIKSTNTYVGYNKENQIEFEQKHKEVPQIRSIEIIF
jgi:hypothetical protein